MPRWTAFYKRHKMSITMRQKARIGIPAILTGALVAASLSSTMAQSAKNQQAAVVGVWDLEGVDESNTKWIATLVLTQGNDNRVTGHIAWISNNGHSGGEYVTGTYEPKGQTLKMYGTRVEFSDHVVRCTYRAQLSGNGSRLENGKWSDNDPTIPGTWNATRIRLH